MVLIGPEQESRLQALADGSAPRLDYRLVADLCQGNVLSWLPPAPNRCGHWLARRAFTLVGNLRRALFLTRRLAPGSIVYSTGETWGLPVALAGATLRNRPFAHIVYVHRVFSPTWLRFLRATSWLLAVDGWVCVTQFQAGLLRQALGSHGPPVMVISQGVDTTFFDSAQAGPSAAQPYILAVGAEMRNYGLLFEAVRGLPVPVVVKASSAWMQSARNALTSIPPNVKIVEARLSYAGLRDLYAGAALVVVPLYDTPQAAGITTILEAMAMGKCVVATRSNGLPDILVHGKTGVVTEPSAQALTQALAHLLAMPHRRQAFAMAGRRAVISQATIEDHARQVTDLLSSSTTKWVC